ncbi:MAG TPA: NAD(P)H-hydrate dehydratase [Acidimicrobiales bacterium]|nr:NAD(P)H-hydrate dehydratase [Acidimicrobiales bacterium]
MRPVVTVDEARAADAAALEHVDQSVLVARAGRAVALEALELLGGAYARRVTVVAGKGNNGNDGRVAAELLAGRGARVRVFDAADAPSPLGAADLVIDAAYGTGFRGSYVAPEVGPAVPVLAVDIPSGVDADTGVASGRPQPATATVTFAALKPGLLQGDGAALAGDVRVADIGVDVGSPRIGLVEDADVAGRVPSRPRSAHKWQSAVGVVAGSPGMEGAAVLSAQGASHAGAGMVRLMSPGTSGPLAAPGPWPIESVRVPLGSVGWAGDVLAAVARCRAVVVGPGLGRDEPTRAEIRRLVTECPVPLVVDADGLAAFDGAEQLAASVARSPRPVVLTPHDGEFRALVGEPPGPDRIAAARRLAAATGAAVLLKGPLTAVAAPPDAGGGQSVLLASAGSNALATAGTGDVLSGIVGALVARGVPPQTAAALAAHVHGRAAAVGHREGLVAGDLPGLVAQWLSEHLGARPGEDG